MKKALITAVVILTAIASPIIAMAIGETRSFLLNLAPDEQILLLADKIDSSKVENEAKIAELTSQIASQEVKIIEQQKIIDASKTDSQIVQSKVDNETVCRKVNELYLNIPNKPSKACGVVGPTNIVEMYNTIKEAYGEYKDDDKAKDGNGTLLGACYKKYLDVLAPAYNEYMKLKTKCN